MAKKVKLTKRQRNAYSRRAAIMGTEEFRTWWQARRYITPIPSDPFRAFMIDRGLHARRLDKPTWKPRTNRSDLVPVDNFQGRGRPRKYKPRKYKKGYIPIKARPIKELTKEEKEIKAFVGKMAEHYHVPEPDIYFVRESGEGVGAMFHGGIGINPFMKLGVKSAPKRMAAYKAVAAHEMGHHVHKVSQTGLTKALGVKITPYHEASRVEGEQIAWKIADPFMKERRPVQKWLKQYYLGTYTGKSRKARMKSRGY